MRTTVLIVDDHAGFRAAATAVLDGDAFAVVGACASGAGAHAAIAELRPDVVLLDVHLPGEDGVAIAWEIAVRPAAPSVVLVSSRSRASIAARLVDAPVRGFVPKDELSATRLAAVLA